MDMDLAKSSIHIQPFYNSKLIKSVEISIKLNNFSFSFKMKIKITDKNQLAYSCKQKR